MMFDFFDGWRRKLGCVALVMAMALTLSWIRSMWIRGEIKFPVGSRLNMLFEVEGRLYWVAATSAEVKSPWGFRWAYPSQDAFGDFVAYASVEDFEENFASTRNLDLNQFRYWTFYHCGFVIPLTLLSAYLILWPGMRKGTNSRESELT